MNVLDYYDGLLKSYSDVHGEIRSDATRLASLTIAHNYLIDFDILIGAISRRPESEVMVAAVKEFQLALLALTSGQYRHAFVGLRLFFELILASVQFSAREIDLRMWQRGEKDINWTSIKDVQSGIFSVSFIRSFNPGFEGYGKQYSAIAEAAYRECSEFVHGNAHTHAVLPAEIKYREDVFSDWCEKAKSMRLVVLFAYIARYGNYVDLTGAPGLDSLMLDALGHISVVRDAFSKSTKE